MRRGGNRMARIAHVGQGGRVPANACSRWGGCRAQCCVGGTDIAAAGLGWGIYVLAILEKEYPPPGYAEIQAKAKAASAGMWSSEFMMPDEWRLAYDTYNPQVPLRRVEVCWP